MTNITEITRRDIFALFQYGFDIDEFFESKRICYNCYGRLNEMDFLKRLYDLNKLPSNDSRFENAEGDIWQHTINNDDFESGWIFEDERFGLLNGSDEVLLSFLCSVFHPAVRIENGYWKEFLDAINGLLRNDGYELYPESKISGRDVYGWKKFNPDESALFIPFSQRHLKDIKDKKLHLTLKLNARNQIYNLLEKYSTPYRETDETGWQHYITTDECVFRDISQFYKPKCYDSDGKYVETRDMQKFVSKSSPFCVLDAVEFFEKYNSEGEFSAKVNALFKLNSVPYRFDQGRLVGVADISIDKSDISSIPEIGLKELVIEADKYYRDGNKQIAVEKIWDAFERLKSYYSPKFGKSDSANKIIDDMSGTNPEFKSLYQEEFRTLTKIGNEFRIRHHETTKIDITDTRQYDYFYGRCLALISVAILYLKEGEI